MYFLLLTYIVITFCESSNINFDTANSLVSTNISQSFAKSRNEKGNPLSKTFAESNQHKDFNRSLLYTFNNSNYTQRFLSSKKKKIRKNSLEKKYEFKIPFMNHNSRKLNNNLNSQFNKAKVTKQKSCDLPKKKILENNKENVINNNNDRKFSILDVPAPIDDNEEHKEKTMTEKLNDLIQNKELEDKLQKKEIFDMQTNSLTKKEKALYLLITSGVLPIKDKIILSRSSEYLKTQFSIKKLLKENKKILEEKVIQLENSICELNSTDKYKFTLSKTSTMILSFITSKDEDDFKSLAVTPNNESVISSFIKLLLLFDKDKPTLSSTDSSTIIMSFYYFIYQKHSIRTIKEYFDLVIFPTFIDKNDVIFNTSFHDIISICKTHQDLFDVGSLTHISKLISFVSYSLKEVVAWIELLMENGRKIGKIENSINKIYIIMDKYNNDNFQSEEESN